MPASVKKLNRLLAKMPRQSVSKLLSHTPFIPKVPKRSSSSVSISSSTPSSLHSYHRKISSFSGSRTDINTHLSEEFPSNEKGNNSNNKSIDKKSSPGIPFWKSFVQTILFFGGDSSQGGSEGNLNNTGKFIIAAFAYSVVLIAGIKKWRNRK
jgi:hypothetical protein